jgi:ankyrin repeat protein
MGKTSPTTFAGRFTAWVPKPKSGNTIGGKHSGKTRLHYAVIKGDHEEVSRLLSGYSAKTSPLPILPISGGGNALDINTQDKLGRSALHWAAAQGKMECARQLMNHAETDRLLQDQDGRTPLHEAAIKGYDHVISMLLEHNDVQNSINTGDNRHRTALHWAAEDSNRDTVRLLLDGGADVSREDNCKSTALHSAAKIGDKDIVRLLLDRGADVSKEDIRNRTALHLAAENGDEDMVRLLLDRGADVSREDDCRFTALHRAAQYGHLEVAKTLIERGAKPQAAMFRLAAEGNHETVGTLMFYVINFEHEDEPMIPRGWRLRSDPDVGKELLLKTARYGHSFIMQQLLETGKVGVDWKDSNGRTPLMEAVSHGNTAIVQQLLATGEVDVNLKDSDGEIPLMEAISHGNMAIVQQLLETGKIDIDRKLLLKFIPNGNITSLEQFVGVAIETLSG